MSKNTAITILSAALVASVGGAALAQNVRSLVMTPGKGVSFYMGSKHGITHFISENGACKLTVAVGENPDQQGMNPTGTARMVMSVVPGMPARYETSEGQALVFSCLPGAQGMSLDMPPDVQVKP